MTQPSYVISTGVYKTSISRYSRLPMLTPWHEVSQYSLNTYLSCVFPYGLRLFLRSDSLSYLCLKLITKLLVVSQQCEYGIAALRQLGITV